MFIAAAIVSSLLAAALVASGAAKLAKDPRQPMIMETVIAMAAVSFKSAARTGDH